MKIRSTGRGLVNTSNLSSSATSPIQEGKRNPTQRNSKELYSRYVDERLFEPQGSDSYSNHVFTSNVVLLIIQYNTKDYPKL